MTAGDGPTLPDDSVVFESPEHVGQSLAAGSWLWTWQMCVAQQADRVLNPADNIEPDAEAYLFIVALRQMLRAVGWVRGSRTAQ